MDTQLKKGVLDLCVLAALAKKDKYGYELVQAISKTVIITEGTIYPLLRRLKDDGFVETYLQESSSGPPRKYYRLTKEGKREEVRLRKEWKSFNEKINSFLRGL